MRRRRVPVRLLMLLALSVLALVHGVAGAATHVDHKPGGVLVRTAEPAHHSSVSMAAVPSQQLPRHPSPSVSRDTGSGGGHADLSCKVMNGGSSVLPTAGDGTGSGQPLGSQDLPATSRVGRTAWPTPRACLALLSVLRI